MWGNEGIYLGRSGEDLYSIRGPNSKAVKFSKILCRQCNNHRSQPFDNAYDKYFDFIQSNGDRLCRARSLDWREIYGESWQEEARLLGSYAVKNFGCWMAESGFTPPRAFVTFLDGGDLADTRLMLARQESASLAYRAMALDGETRFDRGTGVLDAHGWVNGERTRLVGYESFSYVADICMRFNWAAETGEGELFWQSPNTAIDLMPASISQRALAAKIGVRAMGRRASRLFQKSP
ncbi:MAG: hypothetical protein L0G46_02640 [Kocuria sp.]|nr:hypothetical protein [Kocuria sp.]